MWTRVHYFYLLAAAVVFLMLHFYFVATWDSQFAQDLPRGYAPGALPPFFSSSPKSTTIAQAVVFATALVLTLIPSGKSPWIGIAMWAGVMLAIVLIWVGTPQLRNDSNMWPIDLVFLAVMVGIPMLIGRTLGLVYWRIRIGQKLEWWVVVGAIAALALVVWSSPWGYRWLKANHFLLERNGYAFSVRALSRWSSGNARYHQSHWDAKMARFTTCVAQEPRMTCSHRTPQAVV